MYAPAHICRELYRVHKWLRLAWMGRERRYEEDLNRGGFVIVQLLHVSDVGPIWRPKTVKELWDVETYQTESGQWSMRGVERGPIYNRNGGTSLDWDPLLRRPVLVVSCNPQFGLSTQAVFDGSVLTYVKKHLISPRDYLQKQVKGAAARGKELDKKMNDLSTEMVDYLYHEANKTASTSPMIAKKHIAETPRLTQHRAGNGFSFEKYLVNKLPKSMRDAADATNIRFR